MPLRHIRIEPPAGTDPAASSLPRTCSSIELRRHELEEVDSNHHCRGQGPADCRYLTLHGSRRRVLPPAGRPYKGRPVVGPSGHVPPVRFELTLPGASCRCLLPVGLRGLRASEPPPGADPGHPLYESGAAAVRGGKLPAVDSNHDRRAQNAASCQLDERALVRAARFERALHRI